MQSATAREHSSYSLQAASSPPSADTAGFGVYLHWPFCASKCPYCDFNSHVRAGGIDQARYLSAFQRELRYFHDLLGVRTVTSIFFGGGTPSLMSPATVGGILDGIARLWAIAPEAEITLEANPSSVEAERFRGYRLAGVNRISLGVQALRDDDLRRLGRLHTVGEAKSAITVAANAFDRWTFDLIYARPNQQLAAWREELAEALELASGHLSLYQLTIEQGTPFALLHASGKLQIPDDERADGLYRLTQEMTAARGLPAYEISNHARPGQECRHNLLYWRYGEYVGAGPGAHGRILTNGARLATTTERSPECWLARVEEQGHGLVEQLALSREQQADEALLMGLRLEEGIDLARLQEISGLAPRQEAVDELLDYGVLERLDGADRIKATARGRLILNELVLRLSASFRAAA
jgi:putative oxygen-independent coproporphyrinogen III oxidase